MLANYIKLELSSSSVICQVIYYVVIDLHNWFMLIQEVIHSRQIRQHAFHGVEI